MARRHSVSAESGESADAPTPPPHRRNDLAEAACLVNRQRTVPANWERIRTFLKRLSGGTGGAVFTVCVVSDRVIRRYNRQFRNQNEATDVLSFPLQEAGQHTAAYLGDILISAETARRNAARFGLRLEEEMQLLALHGVLHLLGHDHETDGGRMARLERRWCAQLGLPRGLTERSPRPRAGKPQRGGRRR